MVDNFWPKLVEVLQPSYFFYCVYSHILGNSVHGLRLPESLHLPAPFPESSTSCVAIPASCPALSTHIMGNPQEEATELKNKGNGAFKNQDWPAALEYYTKAIELWDKEPSFYTNRAQVRNRRAAAHSRLLTPLVRQTSSLSRMDMQCKMRTRRSDSTRIMSR